MFVSCLQKNFWTKSYYGFCSQLLDLNSQDSKIFKTGDSYKILGAEIAENIRYIFHPRNPKLS